MASRHFRRHSLFIALLWVAPSVGRAEDGGASAYAQGLDALDKADWPAALSAFSAAIDADEDKGDYYLARAVAKVLAEKFPEAQKDLNRALKLKPDEFDSKLWLAASYFMMNNPEEGSKIFTHGRQEDYPYSELVYTMAQNYMGSRYRGGYYDPVQKKRVQASEPLRGNFPRAAAAFVARHRTGSAAAAATTLVSVTVLIKDEKWADALKDLELLRQAKPDDPRILELHATVAGGVHDYLTARRELTILLTADPFAARHYLLRAQMAAALGDIPHANADLEVARKLDSQAVADWPMRAAIETLGAIMPAREDIAKLLAKLKEDSQAGADSAALLGMATDLVKAVNCYRLRADEAYQNRLRDLLAATKADPKNADALADLGEFLYHEATHVRGESVEPRAEYATYRPTSQESIASEMQRAEASVDAALTMKPQHVKALTYKVGCLMWRLKWGDAEVLVTKALELAPDSPKLLELFSQLLDHAAGVKAGKAADLRSVDTWSDMSYIYWRAPSQAELDQADEYDRQAQELWELGRKYIEAAAKAAAGTARGFYYDGVIARRNKDMDTCRAAFEKAVELAPDMIEARDQLQAIYTALGLTDKAHEQYSAANNIVETTAGPMLRLAWLETARTARKAAREASNKAWAIDPADPRSPAYLGVTQQDAEKYDEAIAYYRIALALLEVRAQMHGQSMEPGGKGSINELDLGLALCLHMRLAETYNAAGQAEKCLATYRRIAALAPRISDDQLHSELVQGMLPDPAADQTRVPEARPAGYYLAWAYVKLGDAARAADEFDEADTAYKAVQKLEGEWPMTVEGRHHLDGPAAYARLGQVRVLMAKNRYDEAFRLLTREGFPDNSESFRKEVRQLQDEITRHRQGR